MLPLSDPIVNLEAIDYQLPPFVKFPYGREFMGNLQYEPNLGCSSFKIKPAEHDDMPHITMISSGGCSLKVKALNAENAGVQLLIVMLKDKESDYHAFSQSFEHTALAINIPTVTVTQEVGAKLNHILEKEDDIMLKFSMPIPQHDIVTIDFFIRLSDVNFYSFLESLDSYINQFGDKLAVEFNIYLNEVNSDTAVEIAKLQLMLKCLEADIVFPILGLFGRVCVAKQSMSPACFEQQLSELNTQQYSSWKNCYRRIDQNAISQTIDTVSFNSNKGSSFLLINKSQYSGSYKAENLFEAICAAFVKSPDNCLYLNSKYTSLTKFNEMKKTKRYNKIWFIVVSITISVALVVVSAFTLLYVFGSIYQRQLNERVEIVVKETIDRHNGLKGNI